MHTETMIVFWLMRITLCAIIGFVAGKIGRTPWKWAIFSVLAGSAISMVAMMVALWLFPVKKAVA